MFYEEYLWFYISYVIMYILQRDYKNQTFLGMSILSALSLVAVDTAALCFIHMPISNDMLNSLMVTGGVQFYNEYESLGSKDSYQYECLRSGNVSNLIFW